MNPLSKASEQVGRVAIRAVDYVVEHRVSDAEHLVGRARAALPGASDRVVADSIVARVAREMAAVGAVTGAVAAAPGVGTGAALATGAADVGVAFGRIATMAIAVGLAHGVDLSDHEVRKAFVYGVLSGSESSLTDQERKAGRLKRELGQQAVSRKSAIPALGQVNEAIASRVGTRVLGRLVTQEAALKVATLLPLGIGAGVGAIGNRALVTAVGRTARARAEAELAAAAAATASTSTSSGRAAVQRALPPAARRVGERLRSALR